MLTVQKLLQDLKTFEDYERTKGFPSHLKSFKSKCDWFDKHILNLNT